jgi:hypothetical protein
VKPALTILRVFGVLTAIVLVSLSAVRVYTIRCDAEAIAISMSGELFLLPCIRIKHRTIWWTLFSLLCVPCLWWALVAPIFFVGLWRSPESFGGYVANLLFIVSWFVAMLTPVSLWLLRPKRPNSNDIRVT